MCRDQNVERQLCLFMSSGSHVLASRSAQINDKDMEKRKSCGRARVKDKTSMAKSKTNEIWLSITWRERKDEGMRA